MFGEGYPDGECVERITRPLSILFFPPASLAATVRGAKKRNTKTPQERKTESAIVAKHAGCTRIAFWEIDGG